MAREIFLYHCLWVTKFCVMFGRSRIPGKVRAHNSFIVLRCIALKMMKYLRKIRIQGLMSLTHAQGCGSTAWISNNPWERSPLGCLDNGQWASSRLNKVKILIAFASMLLYLERNWISTRQNQINCAILPSRMEEHRVSWENMENIKQMTWNTLFMIQNTLVMTQQWERWAICVRPWDEMFCKSCQRLVESNIHKFQKKETENANHRCSCYGCREGVSVEQLFRCASIS